jgi:hypothetical protein
MCNRLETNLNGSGNGLRHNNRYSYQLSQRAIDRQVIVDPHRGGPVSGKHVKISARQADELCRLTAAAEQQSVFGEISGSNRLS